MKRLSVGQAAGGDDARHDFCLVVVVVFKSHCRWRRLGGLRAAVDVPFFTACRRIRLVQSPTYARLGLFCC